MVHTVTIEANESLNVPIRGDGAERGDESLPLLTNKALEASAAVEESAVEVEQYGVNLGFHPHSGKYLSRPA